MDSLNGIGSSTAAEIALLSDPIAIMKFIPEEDYRRIVRMLPILCVDIILRDSNGEYFLVERANEPLKGRFWVIGGRVHKGETMWEAARRKVKEEAGLEAAGLTVAGYYEEMFTESPFQNEPGVHTVSIVFSAICDNMNDAQLDSQSRRWILSKHLPEDFIFHPFDRETLQYQPFLTRKEISETKQPRKTHE